MPSKDLDAVQRKFDLWRARRRRGARIPRALWNAAVEMARELGVSKVASATRVDYYALKERLEAAPDPVRHDAFVEVVLPGQESGECVVEFEDSRGRLRVELRGTAIGQLGPLIERAWGHRR